MSRCYDPSQKSYVNYGARGITVSPRWHHFRFFAEDMGMRPTPEHSIERVDNGRGYEASNCCWATGMEQATNRRLFKNSTTGRAGVAKLAENQWLARCTYLGVYYDLGHYRTRDEASLARDRFTNLMRADLGQARAGLIPRDQVIWNTSTTRHRGVVPHADGGYTARCTINGVRHYVGYFNTVTEASDARSHFINTQTC